MRRARVVTSIYANGESVDGFALTRPGEPGKTVAPVEAP
jgi:hypothetical protein